MKRAELPPAHARHSMLLVVVVVVVVVWGCGVWIMRRGMLLLLRYVCVCVLGGGGMIRPSCPPSTLCGDGEGMG